LGIAAKVPQKETKQTFGEGLKTIRPYERSTCEKPKKRHTGAKNLPALTNMRGRGNRSRKTDALGAGRGTGVPGVKRGMVKGKEQKRGKKKTPMGDRKKKKTENIREERGGKIHMGELGQ